MLNKMDLAALYSRIDSAIEQHRADALKLLQSLVQIPSVEGNEKPCQEILNRTLHEIGLDVDYWYPLDAELQSHPAYVPTGKSYADRPNVVGIYKGAGSGRSLILNGHVDVVPTGDESCWQYNPWGGELIDGRVYGRGAADMKGGVVANVLAIKAIVASDIHLQGDLIIENVVDEEAGGNGTLAAILRGYTGDACIFTEPTGLNRVSVSNRGAQFFRIVVSGQEGGIEYRHELINPIRKAIEVFYAVEAYSMMRESVVAHPLYEQGYKTKVPTGICRFVSGEWPSTIPSQAILEGSIECLPGEDIQDIKRAFRAYIEEWAAKDPWLCDHLQLEWFGLWFESAEINSNHPMVTTLSAIAESTTGEKVKVGGAGGCDLRLPVVYGHTPAVLFGPKGSLIHGTDEYIEFEQVVTCAKILARMAIEWCGLS